MSAQRDTIIALTFTTIFLIQQSGLIVSIENQPHAQLFGFGCGCCCCPVGVPGGCAWAYAISGIAKEKRMIVRVMRAIAMCILLVKKYITIESTPHSFD